MRGLIVRQLVGRKKVEAGVGGGPGAGVGPVDSTVELEEAGLQELDAAGVEVGGRAEGLGADPPVGLVLGSARPQRQQGDAEAVLSVDLVSGHQREQGRDLGLLPGRKQAWLLLLTKLHHAKSVIFWLNTAIYIV
jgi:hypothetical protein